MLDFGAGAGRHVAEFLAAGYDTVRVDQTFSSHAGGSAPQRYLHRVQPPDYVLPFEDSAFDLVYSTSVMEHVVYPGRALAEIARVLQPDGISIHCFPSRWRPIEPHMLTPLGGRFNSFALCALWARLGIRNVHQQGLGAREVALANAQYAKTGISYPTAREWRLRSAAAFATVRWEEGAYIEATRPVSRVSRLVAPARVVPAPALCAHTRARARQPALMCGIAGILGATRGAAELRGDAAAMAGCLEHRGPDDSGVEAGDGWALAMRRLAVQDTSDAGHQPMRLRDLTLVFNGEVYNFAELRGELEGHGYTFASRSDTEVVLAALEHWGTGALHRFNGMFALALVDRGRRRALLARDRFGKKPLFYGRLRGGVHFASELKSLLRVARDELTLCPDALAEYFRFQYVPAPRSIFGEVSKLPSASWVEVDLDSGAVGEPVTYWSLPRGGTGAPASPEEVVETVRRAVGRRLVADVPVGAFLSGGTDSSLVVAAMCASAADVRTFSIGFADPRFDESRWSDGVAAKLGTRHTHRRLEWRDAMALVPALASSYDEPFADSSALPTLAVSRLAREHVTVALSGDGGDELFGGYARYRVSRMLRVAALTPRPVGRGLQRGPAGRASRAGRGCSVGWPRRPTRPGCTASSFRSGRRTSLPACCREPTTRQAPGRASAATAAGRPSA